MFMEKNELPSCNSDLLFFLRDGKACWVCKIGVSVPSLEEGASIISIDEIFHGYIKFSEMVLNLKCICLKFI